MIVFKRFLCFGIVTCFVFFSGVSIAEEKAEENQAVTGDLFQKQLSELTDQIKAQKEEADALRQIVNDQQSQIETLKNMNKEMKQVIQNTNQTELSDQLKEQKEVTRKLKETIKNQQSRIQTLQKNVSRVYKQAIEDTAQIEEQQQMAGELKKSTQEQQEQLDTLKSNLAFVYKQSLRDTGIIEKYKLGNEVYLRSSYFDLNREDMISSGGLENDEYDNAFVNYFDLKFSALPSDEVQFNATLTMYKLWGTWNSPEVVSSSDFNYSSNPSDTGVKVKRVYVDYRPQWLGRHLNLTFGRLPTSDGYLSRYKYNRPSQTSYPDLAFNAESDGGALTFYFKTPIFKSLNLVYARSEDETDMHPFEKDPQGLDDIDFYVAQLNSRLFFFDDSTFTLQWLRVNNIRSTGDNLIRDGVDDYNMYIELKGLPEPVVKNLTINDLTFPQELGYVDKYTMQLNNDRLFDSPVDFFASVAWSRSRTNGERIYAEDGNGNPMDLATLPKFKDAASLYLVSSDNQESHSGWAFYAGLRYNIESERFKNPKIGVEYNKGSEYWVGLNVADLDPYQKLNIRGSVWEIYWVQPCVENMLQFRTGYQYVDREYTDTLFGGLYGAPTDTDEKDKLFYCSFEFMY